jgi:hypothetical protein
MRRKETRARKETKTGQRFYRQRGENNGRRQKYSRHKDA